MGGGIFCWGERSKGLIFWAGDVAARYNNTSYGLGTRLVATVRQCSGVGVGGGGTEPEPSTLKTNINCN